MKEKKLNWSVLLQSQTLKSHLQHSFLQPQTKSNNRYYLKKSKSHFKVSKFNSYVLRSQKVKCPHCDSVSHSIVAYETNLLGYLLAILGILVFGVMSMILMPFLVGLTKQAVHKCAKCLNDVK